MINIERLRHLASELYRQARAAKDPRVKSTLKLRGDRLLRQAKELQGNDRMTVQAAFPDSNFKIGRHDS